MKSDWFFNIFEDKLFEDGLDSVESAFKGDGGQSQCMMELTFEGRLTDLPG